MIDHKIQRKEKRFTLVLCLLIKKAYVRLLREKLWWVLEKENVSRCHNNVIEVTYDEVMTSLKILYKRTNPLAFTKVLYQESTLSPNLV